MTWGKVPAANAGNLMTALTSTLYFVSIGRFTVIWERDGSTEGSLAPTERKV